MRCVMCSEMMKNNENHRRVLNFVERTCGVCKAWTDLLPSINQLHKTAYKYNVEILV